MFLRAILLLSFFALLIEGFAIPAIKRDNENQNSYTGSASVEWLDSNQNVHIRTFHVHMDGQLMLSSYDQDGPGWATNETTKYVSSGETNGIAAVSLRPGTATHAIHIYYNSVSDNSMKSFVYRVPEKDWLEDTNFNNLGIKGQAPRAAVTWTNSGAVYPSIRVYFVELTGKPAGFTNVYSCALWEAQFENGWTKSKIRTFQQKGDSFSDSLAAITWSGSTGRNLRVYYYADKYMGELSWDPTSTSWTETKQWSQFADEQNVRARLTAIEYTGSSSHQIRVYRNAARDPTPNSVHEYIYDGGSQTWTDNVLPQGVVTGTFSGAQQSSIAWTGPDASKVHIRLYEWKRVSASSWVISENTFDTSAPWQADTFQLH